MGGGAADGQAPIVEREVFAGKACCKPGFGFAGEDGVDAAFLAERFLKRLQREEGVARRLRGRREVEAAAEVCSRRGRRGQVALTTDSTADCVALAEKRLRRNDAGLAHAKIDRVARLGAQLVGKRFA